MTMRFPGLGNLPPFRHFAGERREFWVQVWEGNSYSPAILKIAWLDYYTQAGFNTGYTGPLSAIAQSLAELLGRNVRIVTENNEPVAHSKL